MNRFVGTLLPAWLLGLLTAAYSPPLLAQDATTRTRILTVELSGETAFAPPYLLAYVRGERAGTVPGTFEIPADGAPVTISIGFDPFTPAPLYRLSLDERELALQMAMTNVQTFFVRQHSGGSFWDQFYWAGDFDLYSRIEKVAADRYRLILPANPYDLIATRWREQKADIRSAGGWDQEKIDSLRTPVDGQPPQVKWLASSRDTIPAVTSTAPAGTKSQPSDWHISRTTDGVTFVRKGAWLIGSTPAGAAIYTENGPLGSTVWQDELPQGASSFVALKLDGYIDVMYNCIASPATCSKHKYCSVVQTPQQNKLICKLKKL
ncbi:hypothetical protein [Ancylobacter terrae]|uniref:hypothetical protein n=1 Tax=Ancylobacter sp. sgz301288 TaxID=3342077 RepID=UPI003859210F